MKIETNSLVFSNLPRQFRVIRCVDVVSGAIQVDSSRRYPFRGRSRIDVEGRGESAVISLFLVSTCSPLLASQHVQQRWRYLRESHLRLAQTCSARQGRRERQCSIVFPANSG